MDAVEGLVDDLGWCSFGLRRSVRELPVKLLSKGGFPLFCLPALFLIEGAGFLSVFLSGAKDLTVFPDGRCRCRDGFLKAALFQFAFPDDDDAPTLCLQLAPGVLVTLPVAGYLGGPEVGVGPGDRVILAVLVAVPEAAVDEDDGAVLGEDDVRRAWKAAVVDAVAEAEAPEGATQEELRLGGGGVDGGHVAVALLWSVVVGHLSLSVHKSTGKFGLLQDIH